MLRAQRSFFRQARVTNSLVAVRFRAVSTCSFNHVARFGLPFTFIVAIVISHFAVM
jgi:hypothetical protein